LDLPTIYANLDKVLYETQQLYEKAIDSYGEVNNKYAKAFIKYRKQKQVATIDAREKYPVTLCSDIVQGETAELKGKVLKLEGEKKKLEKLIAAYDSRMNLLKFLGRMAGKVTE